MRPIMPIKALAFLNALVFEENSAHFDSYWDFLEIFFLTFSPLEDGLFGDV